MLKKIIPFITIMTSVALAFKITKLDNKKYILIQDQDVYTFSEYEYLYHMTNLTKILQPYENIVKNAYNLENKPESQILINRIEILKTQLTSDRNKRSLNFLGSALKFITGTPDHEDEIEIKTRLNQLVENNNQQKIINSRFEEIMNKLKIEEVNEEFMLNEVYTELLTLTITINFAKNNNFYSGTLDLKEIKEIISNEKIQLPIINILEYSDIHVCKFKQTIITVYKYPIVEKKCKLYKVYPLSQRNGKLILDSKIAFCNNEFKRIKNCKNVVDTNICKINNPDNCTLSILNDKPAQCNTKLENNANLEDLGNGNVFIDNKHEILDQTYNGPHLVQFEQNITIDSVRYINEKQTLLEIIHKRHNEELTILDVLYSDAPHKFSNIQEISTMFIPLEEHPFMTMLYTFIAIGILITIVYSLVQICKCYRAIQEKKRQELFLTCYNAELQRLQTRTCV